MDSFPEVVLHDLRYLHAVAQAVQLLVVDWSTAVRWAGLCTGRRLRRGKDLVAAWDSSHRREYADFSPRNFFFVHLYCLKQMKLQPEARLMIFTKS